MNKLNKILLLVCILMLAGSIVSSFFVSERALEKHQARMQYEKDVLEADAEWFLDNANALPGDKSKITNIRHVGGGWYEYVFEGETNLHKCVKIGE